MFLLLVTLLLAAVAFVATPLPADLLTTTRRPSLRITDRNGTLLREVRSSPGGRWVPMDPGHVPTVVRQAFIAAEDQRFEQHLGVDPVAMARAVTQALQAGKIVSGASTITQQLARQLVPRPRTLVGKIREVLWALRLNAHLSKDDVLRAYLDRVPLGNDTSGVEAAAQLYFATTAHRLSIAQAALLAGIARAPEACEPYRHLGCAQRRMEQVVERMRLLGMIDDENAQRARETPLDLEKPRREFRAPHFVQGILRMLPQLDPQELTTVRTTLDAELQEDVEEAVRVELSGLKSRQVTQAAVMVVDNATGEVLAYVGSSDFFDVPLLGQNDGVTALRQPGSALKPFVYGLALSQGYTAATLLADVETHLATPTGMYAPQNYDRRIHGPVRLRAALANSYNVPAVRLTDSLGPERVLGVLRGAGLTSLREGIDRYGVGLVLGNGEITLHDLTAAYAGLANGGVRVAAQHVLSTMDSSGKSMRVTAMQGGTRFLDAGAVNLLVDIISDETARTPAFGLDNALRLKFPVAAKTGTSRAHVDNWTLGFTRERTVGVWVGNFDGKPMQRVSGITGAGPVFRSVMERAMQGLTPLPLVDHARLETVAICPLSGQLTTSACPARMTERFLPGTLPTTPCAMHRQVPQDNVHCTQANGRNGVMLDVGAEFYGWASAEGLNGGPWPDCEPTPGKRRPQLLLPVDGDEYLIDPGIPARSQSIPVKVLASSNHQLELRTEDGAVIPLPAPYVATVSADPGRHRVELWERGAAAPTMTAEYRVR